MAEDSVQGLNAPQTETDQVNTDDVAVTGENATDEPKAEPKEKVFTLKEVEDQVSKVQSAAFKEAAQAKKDKDVAERRAMEAEARSKEIEKRLQALEAEKEREYEERLSQTGQGDELIRFNRQLKERERRIAALEEESQRRYTAGEIGLKRLNADDLIERLGLPDTKDVKTSLMAARSAAEMKDLANDIRIKTLEKALEEAKSGTKGTNKPESETNDIIPKHIDSGTRTVAPPKTLNDDEFIRQYGDGKLSSAKDHKRAKEIYDKMLKGG